MNDRPRYMLFGYDRYYPGGGKEDCMGMFATIEDARHAEITRTEEYLPFEYWDILDLDSGEWVE